MFLVGVDKAGSTTAVEACNKAGVPVFMVASESEGGEYKFVGFNKKKTVGLCKVNMWRNMRKREIRSVI